MRLSRLFLLILLVATSHLAWGGNWNGTYFAKAKANVAPSGGGKVYVSASSEAPSADQYTLDAWAKIESAQSGSGDSAPATHDVEAYLFARNNPLKVFDHWTDSSGKNIGSDNPQKVTLSGSLNDTSNLPEATWTAHFVDAPNPLMLTNRCPYATATLDIVENSIGQTVTLTATVPIVPAYKCKNQITDFIGWYDAEADTCLSTDFTYKHTIVKPIEIESRFKYYGGIEPGSYYRVMNCFGRAMTVEGGYKLNWSNGADLSGVLCWTMPENIVYSDFQGKKYANDIPAEIETLPSTIIYLTGTPSGNKLTAAKCEGQGVNTQSMTGQTFTIQPSNGMPGYHDVVSGSYSLKYGNKTIVSNNDGCRVQVGNKGDNAYQWMAFVRINEENIDKYWFGVHPSTDMEFDDGLWTSMYTAFPYQCYEPDGVKPYYIAEMTTVNGENYCELIEIEDGIVPAKTPVLLKCRKPEAGKEAEYSSKNNRLIPLDPAVYHIPAIEDNLLHGEFQLNQSSSNPNHTKFDSSKMRIFSVNDAGQVGFYKLAEGTELTANKVWLDVAELSEAAKAAPMHIRVGGESAGIDAVDVSEEAVDVARPEQTTIYDLQGRAVRETVPGQMYIINGKKVVRL